MAIYKVFKKIKNNNLLGNTELIGEYKKFDEALAVAHKSQYTFIKCDGEKVWENDDITDNVRFN